MPELRFHAAWSLTAALALALPATAGAAALPPAGADLGAAGWEYAPTGGAWRAVTVPHVTDGDPAEQDFRGGTGTYRLRLAAPATTPGFDWGIRFDQVRRTATVRLDGRVIARHSDPYGPFTVALPQLRDGRPHELRVDVSNVKGREPREGWWNWGGITRPARLVPLGAAMARDAGFVSRRRGGRWEVLVDTEVVNRTGNVLRPRVEARVGDNHATRLVRPLAPGERARVRLAVAIAGTPRLWSPSDPQLYDAELRTTALGSVQQVERRRVGLRTVTVRHGLLELNGRPVELRGASIHEDVPGRGPAMTDADIRGIVRDLKAIGANVTRAHYALDERLLRALDAAGILVWGQAPVYHADRQLETPAGRAAALQTVRDTVLAARSHPSIITHSVANELSVIPDGVPGTAAFLRDARALTRDLDPTLPTSVDTLSYPGFPRSEAYAAFDLIGINAYFGWYPGKREHPTANVNDLAPYLDAMRRMYPAQGFVLTEFGAESTFHGPAAVKETFAFQADYARKVLGAVERAPWLSGAIYWTLREFAVKPRWDGGAQRTGVERDGIHNKGLLTYDGRPKPAWRVVREEIARTPLDRPEAEAALVAGVRLPAADRGTRVPAAVVALAFLLLLALDVWAVLGWRRAVDAETRDVRARALAAARSRRIATVAAARRREARDRDRELEPAA